MGPSALRHRDNTGSSSHGAPTSREIPRRSRGQAVRDMRKGEACSNSQGLRGPWQLLRQFPDRAVPHRHQSRLRPGLMGS
eukprot:69459-Alexandrium_andersonii.AAC.1